MGSEIKPGVYRVEVGTIHLTETDPSREFAYDKGDLFYVPGTHNDGINIDLHPIYVLGRRKKATKTGFKDFNEIGPDQARKLKNGLRGKFLTRETRRALDKYN